MVNATGAGKAATLLAIKNQVSGLQQTDYPGLDFKTWLGRVAGLESRPVEKNLNEYDCRNNRLARLALDTDNFRETVERIKNKYASHRIGVFLGTSTSGIAATEHAYCQRESSAPLADSFDLLHTHNVASVVAYTRASLGLTGPGICLSTACSSSAKVFAVAQRHINAGICDAAIVGGVDSLCLTTLYGFNSLQLVSSEPCRPWDSGRDGINIGEAAGFALLEPVEDSSAIVLQGSGESSDAYHLSTPHPEGMGAMRAMEMALQQAGINKEDIGYINLHGTATPSNDAAEDKAVNSVFGSKIPCSSTKGWTGHTLGAAGITEALIAAMVIEHGILPATLNLEQQDSQLQVNVLQENEPVSVDYVISNSFGFGGSNCSLILARA
jgi:3-oxoacyl-[acyl-carrier-protein] synthase-1